MNGLSIIAACGIAACSAPDPQPAPPPSNVEYLLTPAADLAAQAPAIDAFWRAPTNAGTFAGVDGVAIAYRCYRLPGSSPVVVIASGRTEHSGKYREVVHDFWRNGYSVCIHDHRGQGDSGRLLADPAKRQMGHVLRFDDYVTDLDTFVRTVVDRGDHPDRFLVAHSMGGAIATLYLLAQPAVFRAAALASPMHRPDTRPLRLLGCPWMKATEAIGSERWVVLTGPYERHEFDGNLYTTSRERFDAWLVSDEVTPPAARIGGMSRGWVAQACRAADRIADAAPRLAVPVMVLQAVDDEAVVPAAQDDFCRSLPANNRCRPHGMPVPYHGTGHELFIERDAVRDDVMRRILDFFAAQRSRR